MAAPQPVTNREMSKSITRILQHSILQLCNEHIGYSHKLQILGVLCMTVDDEQQEIVVKVNNTLKRVNPILGKDGSQASPNVEHASHSTGSMLPVTVEDQSIHIGNVRSLSPAHSANGRKGRKPNNPVRVQQIYQDPTVLSEGGLDEEEEPVTIIPEAPEESMDSQGLSDQELMEGDRSSPTQAEVGAAKQRMLGALSELKASGSARRKASQPMRDPQYTALPSNGENTNNKVISVEKEFGAELDQAAQDAANSLSDIAENDASQNLSISSTAQKGLSLPIYVPGGSGQPRYGHPVPRIAPTAVTIGPLPSNAINLSQGFSQAQYVSNLSKNAIFSALNGTPEKEPGSSPNGPQGTSTPQRLPQSRFYIDSDADGTIKVKEEPRDDYDYEYGTNLDSSGTSMNDSTTFSIAESFSVTNNLANRANNSTSVLNLSGGSITSIPYSLGLVPTLSGASISGKKVGSPDGLSIRYTSTGPITVGANGRDVSNNSRIKDIILYNESAFTGQTKGAATRIETDFVIDKMGVEGRKRRRRAVDDLFTQEELAEYLGTGGTKSGLFKCQYCKEDYEDITKYIQHTLGAHSTYICHQCGKSFTTKSSLLRHRPIHTGMRRFACSICKKTFYRKDKCKAHIKRHLGTGDSDVVPHIETSPIQMELPVAE